MNKLKKYMVSSDDFYICCDGVHEAGEDTLFLVNNIDFSKAKKCLEIGVGMGIGAVYAQKRVDSFYGVDINLKAVDCSIKNCIINDVNYQNIIVSDCFSNLLEKDFDIIFSNPPQLPTPSNLERMDEIGLANNGGTHGRLIIDKIIDQCSEFLCVGGCLYLLHFDMCDIEKSIKRLEDIGFKVDIIDTKMVSCGKLSYERVSYIKTFFDGIICENNKYYYKIHILKAKKVR